MLLTALLMTTTVAGEDPAPDKKMVQTIGDAISVLETPAPRGPLQPPKPLGNPGSWVTTADYPPAALRIDAEGTTRFRLDIDKAGLVTGCTVVESSGNDDLDLATCDLVTSRGRFAPATDARGRKTAGVYTNSVRWVLGRQSAPEPGELVTSFTVAPDGSVSDCKVTMTGSYDQGKKPEDLCARVPKTVEPYFEDGQSVSKRVTFRMSISVEGAE
jgi:protein TonB